MSLTRTTATGHIKVGKAQKFSTLWKEPQLLRMLRAGETVLPGEEHANWSSNTKWSVLKMYLQVTVHRSSIFKKMHVHTCACHIYKPAITTKREKGPWIWKRAKWEEWGWKEKRCDYEEITGNPTTLYAIFKDTFFFFSLNRSTLHGCIMPIPEGMGDQCQSFLSAD